MRPCNPSRKGRLARLLPLVAGVALAWSTNAGSAWFDNDEKRLVPEADKFVQDKPEALRRFLHTLYMEGEWNAVLNLDLLSLAAIEVKRYDLAERALDMANERILRIYADDPNAEKARSLWSSESVKDWKGEPYERAMSFYYRGLLYLRAGDYQNARAAFLQADIQNAFGQYEKYDANSFALMRWLAAWASHCDGDSRRATELAAGAMKGAPDPFFRTIGTQFPAHLTIYEIGLGPEKVTLGETKSVLGFLPEPDVSGQPRVSYQGTSPAPVAADVAANIDWVAMTRGGRPIQGILDGKALFKQNTAAVADVAGALSQGAVYAALSNVGKDNASVTRSLGSLGLAGSMVGLLADSLSRATNAEADTRYWASLPKKIYVQGLAQSVPDGNIRFATVGNATGRAPMLSGKQGKCSFAWSRELSALAAEEGGVANPSPWPAEPVESGRAQANTVFREQIRSSF